MEQHDLNLQSPRSKFCCRPKYNPKVIRAANIEKHQQILEIVQLGSLTSQLSTTSKVVAIELDRYLIPALEEVLNHFWERENEVIHQDVMKIDWKNSFLIGKVSENGS